MRLFSDFARRAFAAAGRCAATMSVAAGAILIAAAAHADSATDEAAAYFKGKDITIYIGYSPGGNYDLYGRLVAKHMSRHMPGHPNFIPKNMPGAGSLRLAKYIYTAAPKDGTVIGIVARGIPFAPLFGIAGADYDPTKFNWLGSTNDEVSVCAFGAPRRHHRLENATHEGRERRQHGAGLRQRAISKNHQCDLSHENAYRQRLSRRQGCRPRDRAR